MHIASLKSKMDFQKRLKIINEPTNVMKFYFIIITIFLIGCSNNNKDSKQPISSENFAKKESLKINEILGIAVIEPEERIVPLSTEEGGIIKTIYSHIGQSLKKGDIILKLENALEQAQVLQAKSKINTQKEVVQTAIENLNQLKLKLQKAKDDLARDVELNTKDAITKKELDESKYKVQDIQSQIEIQLSTIKQQQTKLKEFNADMQYFQTLEKRKIVLAPNNGTVLSLAVKEGQFLNSTQKIGDFAPIGPLMAITEIDELYADKIKIGQKAVIKKQGKEEEITTGIVKLTSPYLQKKSLFSDNPSELEDRRVREVRIQIDEPDKVLIGARVECVIKLD